MIPFFLIGVLGFAALFFGGVHVWSRSVVILAIFAFSPLILWNAFKTAGDRYPDSQGNAQTGAGAADPRNPDRGGVKTGDPSPSLKNRYLSLFILLVAWGGVHLLPLPAAVVELLSPEAARLWSAVSAPPRLSLYPFMTLDALILGLALLLYLWAALRGLGDRRRIRWVVLGILVLGLFESLYGLVQLAGGRNTILWWENPFYGNVVTGTFINRNHLAAFLSMAICLGIGYLWSLGRPERREPHHRSRRPRIRERIARLAGVFGIRGVLTALALALMLAALLGSASRGGALSLICGVVFMLGLLMARWFRSRRGFALMVVLSLVLAYVGYIAADRLVERLATFDAGLKDRIAMARDAWTMAKDFPLTGSGPGTFEFVFPRYQQFHLEKIVDHAHNDWVQLLAEFGWPGLLAVLAVLAAFLIPAIGRLRERRDGFAVGIGVGGIGAVAAIAVHSLSDFNLHIPANQLLLALILAVTWWALNLPGTEGEAGGAPAAALSRTRRGRWGAGAAFLLLLMVLGAASFAVVRNWRAEVLARSFPDSTRSEREPEPEELRRARGLAPGNAAYWLRTAERLRMKPGERAGLLTPEEARLPDPVSALLEEGLRRNPSSWRIWRELGWTRFLGSGAPGREREADLREAMRAMEMAASLRPADPRLQVESGTVALATYAAKADGAAAEAWQEAFRRALRLDPRMAGSVADLLVLYLGPKVAGAVEEVLPPDARSRLTAATFLIDQGYGETGMALFREGERRRAAEADALWNEFVKSGGWPDGREARLLRQAADLHPGHPGVLLTRGKVLQALQASERRGEPMGKWRDTRNLAALLEADLEAKRSDPVQQAYYLGLLAKEEGNHARALQWFNRALSLRGQHFPAWIHLRDLLKGSVRSEADRIQLEALEGKIRLYAMERVVPDAWKGAGRREGRPAWRAPFRVDGPVKKVFIRFSGGGGAVWALDVDGRFVEIWKGPAWEGSVAMAIPPGEHEFCLVSWDADLPAAGRGLPYRLEISWK